MQKLPEPGKSGRRNRIREFMGMGIFDVLPFFQHEDKIGVFVIKGAVLFRIVSEIVAGDEGEVLHLA